MKVNMDELEQIGRQIDGAYGMAAALETALTETEGDVSWTHAATGLMELLAIIRKRHSALIDETYKNKREGKEEVSDNDRQS